MIDVVPIETPALGDHSCLAREGEVGLVVAPQHRTGYRSVVAASLPAARDVISIDDEIGNAMTAGLPVVSSQVKKARR